jgi:uncharacterized membrane protein YqjE
VIYGLLHTIREDASAIVYYMQNKDIPGIGEEDQEQRIQVAALRMLTFVGMVFGSLWTLSLLTFEATIPLTTLFKLATAIGIYALAHDTFVMSQNAYRESARYPFQTKLMELFRQHESLEEDQAEQFTHGTLLQPLWMYFYSSQSS